MSRRHSTRWPTYSVAGGIGRWRFLTHWPKHRHVVVRQGHNTPAFQASRAGPFDQWPAGMGFEYFYGFVGGDTSQWQPNLFRNTTPIDPYVGKPGWNLTTAMAAAAIAWLNQLNAIAPDKPFFCYYVPGGTHAPHHPTTEWIEKFKGKFDMGWNALYQRAFTSIGLPIRGVTTQFPTLASIQVSWTPSWPA